MIWNKLCWDTGLCKGPIVIHTTYNTGMAKILAKLELRILSEEVTLVANIYIVEYYLHGVQGVLLIHPGSPRILLI